MQRRHYQRDAARIKQRVVDYSFTGKEKQIETVTYEENKNSFEIPF